MKNKLVCSRTYLYKQKNQGGPKQSDKNIEN